MKEAPPQQRRDLNIAEEKFPEHFSELKEIEKLGLDENRFPLTMRGQTEEWPKAVAWLYGFGHTGDKKLSDVVRERFEEVFNYFKLNLDRFDKALRPTGMTVTDPYQLETTKRNMVLRMLGINEPAVLGDYFSARLNPDSTSPVFRHAHAEREISRDRFLIDRRAEYPDVDRLFGELESEYQLRAENIFKRGRVPRLKLRGRESFTMEQCLRYVLELLEGGKTVTELETSPTFLGMTWDSIKRRLDSNVVMLIEARRKRGRK